MSTIAEIPLTPTPQTFSITLAGAAYHITVQWRDVGGAGWVMDIADVYGNSLINGIPLVTGADLLAQYPQYGFGGQLHVLTDLGVDAAPTFGNLGVTSHVYFVIAP